MDYDLNHVFAVSQNQKPHRAIRDRGRAAFLALGAVDNPCYHTTCSPSPILFSPPTRPAHLAGQAADRGDWRVAPVLCGRSCIYCVAGLAGVTQPALTHVADGLYTFRWPPLAPVTGAPSSALTACAAAASVRPVPFSSPHHSPLPTNH